MSMMRSRWAAIGAAIAVALGGGGLGLVGATSPSDAVAFVPITPCRVIDTRPATQVGPRSAPLAADDTHTVDAVSDTDAAGDCAGLIPSSAVAVSMNVTAVGATEPTFLTIWEADVARPLASSLNPSPGQPPTPNAVTTDLNADGEFSIYNLAGSVHVLADVNGYYADHHHDDRYYTEAEVDAAIAAASAQPPWSVGIPFGDLVNFSAFGPVAQFLTGIGFSSDSNGVVLLGFRLPPEYVAGSDVRVDVLMGFPQLGGDPFPCVSVWRFFGAIGNRFGADAIDLTASWVQTGPSSDIVEIPWTQDDFDQRTIGGGTVTIDGTDLEPGDHVTAILTRHGNDADDTCRTLLVSGLTARATR